MKIERIRFENLSFGFGTAKPIFDNVNFEFPLNETVWIRGSFGSGKSTLLRLIAGLVIPTNGKIIINEQSIHELGFTQYVPYLNQMGFGFDGVGLLVNQTLENNLAIPLRYHKNWSEEKIQAWLTPMLQMFQVEHLKNERPAFVSQSIYKVFLLLRAFVTAPDMMIFNNPLTNLDEIHRVAFLNLIEVFRKEHNLKHVFIASDDEMMLEKLNSKKIWIQDGKILLEEQRKIA